MYRLRKIKVLLAIYMLACAGLWAQNVKITISSATASSYHNGEGADKAIDGDYSTFWHSGNGGGYTTTFPVTFTIKFASASHVDYVRYTPRTGNSNGNWDEVKVEYCSSTNGSNFVTVGTFNLGGSGSSYDFYLNGDAGVTCGQVRFTINSGKGGWASAAEIEAYNLKGKFEAFSDYFSDDLCTTLRSGVTSGNDIEDADVKALVDALLADAEGYKKFRVGEYKAYESLRTVQKRLGTKTEYSPYENPTGVYLQAGEACLVAVSGIGNDPVKLKIKNWVTSESVSSYQLRNGLNYIKATTEGNVFVDYYTDNLEAPNVKVHFINAPVQGYWDQQTMNNEDWEALLEGRSEDDNTILFVQSEHAQLAYPVSAWLEYCSTDVNTLMDYYQNVQDAIRDLLGLKTYNKEVKNRMLYYATTYGFMASGGEGAYCNVESLGAIMTTDATKFDFWGVGHEWGHNNQIPGFHWSGCGEMTNNIYAAWAQFHHTGNRTSDGRPSVLRLEDENSGIDEYSKMRGGRMQAYFEEALRKGVAWQLQDGPDYHNATPGTITVTGRDAEGNDIGPVTTTSRNYDHFLKVVPFWQLNLWGILANKNPYIITKIIEAIRTTENYEATYNTNGKQQINLMKLACEAAKTDLLPFFENAGLLRPIHAYIEDYGAGWNIITEGMINELKASVAAEVAAGRYQAYPDEEINYINGHNYHIYRDNLKLNVTAIQGERNGDKVTIQHSVAQNAVAFETYNADGELLRITMYGLGSNDEHSFTQVLFPSSFDEKENAAYIMAVGYDGERQRVYQTYANEDEAKYGELGRILTGVKEFLNQPSDETNTKVGYYKPSALTDLRTAYNTAKSVYDNQQSVSYVAVYDMLNTEFIKVQNDATARVGIVEGNAYRLENKGYTGRYMSINSEKMIVGETTELTDAQKWYFEAAETEGCYYIKNKSTQTYPGNVETSKKLYADKTTSSEAHAYKLQDMGNGLWALVGSTGLHQGSDVYGYGIVGWTADADASQWYITAVEINSDAEALHNLQELIAKTEALIAEVEGDAAYSSISTALSQAKSQVTTAKAVLEAGNSSAYDALNTKYTALLNAKNSVDNAALDVLKNKLSTLIGNTNSLISQCGEVIYTPATFTGIPSLQTADVTADYYVWTNSQSTQEVTNEDPYRGYLKNLVDGNNDTYFHSDYSGANSTDGLDHHITINMGVANAVSSFSFEYRTRSDASYQFPSEIEVYGSTDNVNYDLLKTISSGLPTKPNSVFTSSVIEVNKPYTYLRIMVTKNNNGTTKGDHQFFHMAELVLNVTGVSESYSVNSHNIGDVTEDMLLATFKQNQEAQATINYAATESQVQKAIDKLQAQYDALYEAKNVVQYVDFTISSNVSGGGVKYQDVDYTTTLSAPSTLEANELKAKDVDGYVAKSITINDTEISIIYNKVYIVTITGGEGEGRVTFGDDEYANDGTFNAEQNSFTAADLTAKDVEGFTKSEVTVNHETGVISVTYTLDKSKLNDLLGDTHTLIYACDGFVNSEFVTAALLEETYAAWITAQNALETVQTRSELNDALNDLQTAHDKLDAAKTSAEQEAAERTELNGQLSALITETKTLIASCYENEVLKFINSEFVTEETISAVRTIVADAEAKCAYNGTPASEYNASIDALTEAKSNLFTAIENAEEEAEQRELLKAELQDLVNNTNTLMALCGEIRTAPATTLSDVVGLQTTHSANNFYLSTNAQESTEGPIAGLTDDDASTFFHSSWMARMNEAHYLQVDMGEQYALKEFAFGYVTRDNGGGGPHPSTIVVSGSNSKDNNSFVELRVINSGLPTGGNKSWSTTENIVTPKMPYRFLRFTVTLSAGTNGCKHSNPDEYFFTMSKFSLTAVPTEATSYADVYEKAGVVTEAQLLEVYYEKESALSIINSANNTELTAAKEALQAKYDALNTAYTTINKSELEALLPEVEALINSCYTDETFNYTGSLYVTTELMDEVNGVVTNARNALDNTVSQDVYDDALTNLKNAQAELQYAIECALFPVLLTADPASPALYIIKTKRDGDNWVLQYDEPTELFSVTTVVEKEPTQAFYFMKGDGSQVYIYPYMAGGKVLAANEVGDASGTAFAMEKGSATYEQWVFVARADGYYNLQPVGTSTYLSNIYGTSHKMGFYRYGPDTDKGSLFKFESTTVEGSYYYLKLKDYYENQAKVAGSNIQGGEAVGYYPTDKANAYNSAYSNATDVLASSTATDEEYTNAYDALKAANEVLVLNMPVVGKYYVIRSAHTGYAANKLMYATGENAIRWDLNKTEVNPEAVWTFTSEGYLENLNTGCAVNTNGGEAKLGTAPKTISIKGIGEDGQVLLTPAGGTPLHADWHGHAVSWGTYDAGSASAWRIVEVEDMSLVEFALKIGQYRHAGLYLNYATEIPEGVKVYIAHTPNGDEGSIIADELDGTILPARTAVIVKGDAGTYNFKYTTKENTKDDLSANLLGGSAYLKYQQVKEEGNRCCVFGRLNDEVGLYKNWVQYVDVNGSTTIEEGEGEDKQVVADYAGTDNGTHFKISANKIYYEYTPSAVAGASAFRFCFYSNEEDGPTTQLNGLTIDEDAVIYNLYGQRLLEVVEPGIYIVNGKKMYVTEKMIRNND